jgi:hypothetical protein
MEPKNIQQEILLNTDTHFAHRQWAENETGEPSNLNAIEQLVKACWDGLVKELIPELDVTLQTNKKLWLWQVHETRSFLALDFYEFPGPKGNADSIDPNLFLLTKILN